MALHRDCSAVRTAGCRFWEQNTLRFIEGPTTTATVSSVSISSTRALSSSNTDANSLSLSSFGTRSASVTNNKSESRSESSSRSPTVQQSASHSVGATRSATYTVSPVFSSWVMSISRSNPSKSRSSTQRSQSTSVTMQCALLPDDGETAVGSLQTLNTSIVSSGAFITLNRAGSLSTTTVGAAPIRRTALLKRTSWHEPLTLPWWHDPW